MSQHDLDLVRTWRNHPDVRRHMYTRHEISAAEHRAWFQRCEVDTSRHLLVFEHDGTPCGFVGLSVLDVLGGRAEWGFYLAPEAPRGIGSRLGGAALTHGFDLLGLHKICGEALAGNERSIRFHERLGFRREGELRAHHHDAGGHHDVVLFGLLATDPAPWRSPTTGASA